MPLNEKMIVIYVPESLIPGLKELSGPITLYMNRLRAEDGFAHTDDEFVASIRTLSTALSLAGISPEIFATMMFRA